MKMIVCMLLCFYQLLFDVRAGEPPQSLYEISAKTLDGQNIPFSVFRGRVLLIVNTASRDKNSPQINKLEELYQKYAENGFVVLAFPSNDFLNEEPGNSQAIKAAYESKFHVTFPLFDEVHVTGPDISPIYTFLTSSKTDPIYGWKVEWAFTKFLVDQNGNVVNRFSTTTEPTDKVVISAIEKTLTRK